jgi:hypothetical protein
MGNSNPKPKLPKELKSRMLGFRLDPKNEADRALLTRIETLAADGVGLRQLVSEAIAAYTQTPIPIRTVDAGAEALATILSELEGIRDRLDNLPVSETPRRRKKETMLPEGLRATIDRLIDTARVGAQVFDDDDV